MGRHSKTVSTRAFFTSGERAKAAGRYGTVSARLGEDSQRQFDQCNLCLARLADPVATPSGFLFCRECILKNLLQQKEALALERRAFDDEGEAAAAAEAAGLAAKAASDVHAFEKLEYGVASSTQGAASSGVAQSSGEAAVIASLREKVDPRDLAERRAGVERSAFWVPASTPGAAASKLPAPDPAPRDPCSGEFLRAKQLIAVQLTRVSEERLLCLGQRQVGAASAAAASAPEGAAGGAEGGADLADGLAAEDARFMCPACLKGLAHQKVYLFASCGHALCEACTKQFVLPTKRCFECNTAIASKAGIIRLQQGGTSFSAHEGSTTVAKKWTPALIS